MKYKVGDKVKIREDLKYGKDYGNVWIAKEMANYKGKVVTIKDIKRDCYTIEEDFENYFWTDEMLEDVKKEKMTIGEIIDNIIENPELIIKKFSKALEDCEKVNEDLKTKLKYKQSEIDFLKGQISVYEKFLKNKEV